MLTRFQKIMILLITLIFTVAIAGLFAQAFNQELVIHFIVAGLLVWIFGAVFISLYLGGCKDSSLFTSMAMSVLAVVACLATMGMGIPVLIIALFYIHGFSG